MPSTVERLSEQQWVPPWIRHQHLTRYQWACEFTLNRSVIDAACGTGYGAAILVERGGAREVLGFDCSAEAIAEAKHVCRLDAVKFEVADVLRLPVADQACDVYASFETIEHIENDRAYVQEVVRVLKPGGRFLCSTPNRLLTNPGITLDGKPFNRFHVREYTAAELKTFLAPYFSTIDLFGQSPYRKRYAGLLNRVGKRLPMLAVRLHQLRKLLGMPLERASWHYPFPLPAAREPEVLIAVCTAPE